MKTWNVYQNEAGDTVAVKEGFNWWSFFFPAIAPFFFRLPNHGIVALALSIGSGFTDPAFQVIVIIVLAITYGVLVNGWASAKLEKEGYRLAASVRAASPQGAKVQVVGSNTPDN